MLRVNASELDNDRIFHRSSYHKSFLSEGSYQRSLFRRAEALSHLINIDKSITSCVNFLHEFLDLLGGHLGAHVCHELFEFRHRNAFILIAIKVSQLSHHILWCVFVL